MLKRKAVIAIFLILTIIITTGCAATSTARPQPDSADATVYVSGEVEYVLEGTTLTLHATTDLLDGAIVRLSIESSLGETLAYTDIEKSGDNLKAQFDVGNIEDDYIYAFATCAPELYGKQPKEVTEVYGRDFQNVDSKQDGVILWGNEGVYVVFTTGQIEF